MDRILKLPNMKKVQLTRSWVLSPEVFALDQGDAGGYRSLEELQLDLSPKMPNGAWYLGPALQVLPPGYRPPAVNARSALVGLR